MHLHLVHGLLLRLELLLELELIALPRVGVRRVVCGAVHSDQAVDPREPALVLVRRHARPLRTAGGGRRGQAGGEQGNARGYHFGSGRHGWSLGRAAYPAVDVITRPLAETSGDVVHTATSLVETGAAPNKDWWKIHSGTERV